MLHHPTVERLHGLRLFGMAAALAEQQSQNSIETVESTKAAFVHPAARQQNEALFRLLQLDDLKLEAFVECRGASAGSARPDRVS